MINRQELISLNRHAEYLRYADIDKIIDKNIDIITELEQIRKSRTDVLVGDYLEMPDGSISRVTYGYKDAVQDGGGSGSFYLLSNGNASYSGGLDSSKEKSRIKDTGKYKKALFWIFSENHSGAHRGFYFYLDVRIWKIEEMPKTAYVKFDDYKLNYKTSVNGKLSNEEIQKYFVGKSFNLGSFPNEEFHTCTECVVYY